MCYERIVKVFWGSNYKDVHRIFVTYEKFHMIGDSGSFLLLHTQLKGQQKPVMKNRFLLFSLYSNIAIAYIHAGLFLEIGTQKTEVRKTLTSVVVLANTYFPGPSPAKYLRHDRA